MPNSKQIPDTTKQIPDTKNNPNPYNSNHLNAELSARF